MNTHILIMILVAALIVGIIFLGRDSVEQYGGFTVYKRGVLLTPGFALQVGDYGASIPIVSVTKIHIITRESIENTLVLWLSSAHDVVYLITIETVSGDAGAVVLVVRSGYNIQELSPALPVQFTAPRIIGNYKVYSVASGAIQK